MKESALKFKQGLKHPLLKDFGTVSSVLQWQNETSTMCFIPDVRRQKHMESIWISSGLKPANSFYLFTYICICLLIYYWCQQLPFLWAGARMSGDVTRCFLLLCWCGNLRE